MISGEVETISGVRSVILLAALLATGCGRHADPAAKSPGANVAWHKLGSWSGQGSVQTASFTSDTGTLRVRWETTPRSGAPPGPPGSFRLTAHSAISGRPLQQVVDHAGPGSGTGYVQQDPHVFYMVVEASQLNWTFTVEEGFGYP